MPSFSGRIPQYQIWQLVAYVRSISGHAALTAAPGRSDAMEVTPRPENSSDTPVPQSPESIPPYPHGTRGPDRDTTR
jgi:cytochrome c oxidase cbb3-type subunit 3